MKRLFAAAGAVLCLFALTTEVRTSDQANVEQQREEGVFNALVARAGQAPVRVIVGVAAPASAASARGGAAGVVNERAGIAAAQGRVMALLPPQFHGTVKRFSAIPFMAFAADAATLQALRASGAVTSIQEDVARRATLATSVPFIGGPTVWAAGYTGAGWAVAVLDSGTDKNHPFLTGKVVSEACYSSNTSESTTMCPGGVESSTATGSGINCLFTQCEHGTHVAGIAAGRGTGFSGVARDSSIVSIEIYSHFPVEDFIAAWDSDIISGLERVLTLSRTLRIAAVNLSLGGGAYNSTAACDAANVATKAAIDQLRAVNIATVIAAGNDGYTGYLSSPGCISTAVSVGSVTDGARATTPDLFSPFTNRASFLSLLAPGQFITSSIPGGGFASFSGTSMATPHVVGAWALMKSANPSSTVSHVLSVLQATGRSDFDAASGLTRKRLLVAPAAGFLGGEGTRFDFDANHTADAVVYRASTGEWFLRGVSATPVPWGTPSLNDRPVPADYTGDKRTDIAVYRPSTGTWFVRGLAAVAWGQQSAGDLPVPADYNGDRLADIAVYRATTGQWFIRGAAVVQFGDPSRDDVPVPADYDGDGRADIAVYRRSTGQWFGLLSTAGAVTVNWGVPAQHDVPMPADYDGDGAADIAVYRPAIGGWLIRLSGGGTQTTIWGVQAQGDVPVPGDYDADGRADIAVYRGSTGQWFVRNVATFAWGDPARGDIAAR